MSTQRRRFGAVIARLRKQNNLTQAQLGDLLNVSAKAISKWETGTGYPEVTLLPKIAGVFHVTIDSLFSENA